MPQQSTVPKSLRRAASAQGKHTPVPPSPGSDTGSGIHQASAPSHCKGGPEKHSPRPRLLGDDLSLNEWKRPSRPNLHDSGSAWGQHGSSIGRHITCASRDSLSSRVHLVIHAPTTGDTPTHPRPSTPHGGDCLRSIARMVVESQG